MNQLLLLSSQGFLADHSQVFHKPFKDLKMAYVTTASKGVSDLSYLDRARKLFREQGYQYEEMDIDGKTEDELRHTLKKFDVVFVTGGSTPYLIRSIRGTGFDKVIKELLPKGLIYMGASAGSYVACPSIEMSFWQHQDKYDHCGLTDLQGMNLVPFLVSVHYKPAYDPILKAGIAKSDYPVRILKDDQALLIQGEKVTLLGGQPEIRL